MQAAYNNTRQAAEFTQLTFQQRAYHYAMIWHLSHIRLRVYSPARLGSFALAPGRHCRRPRQSIGLVKNYGVGRHVDGRYATLPEPAICHAN